jgi:hypothetical protein
MLVLDRKRADEGIQINVPIGMESWGFERPFVVFLEDTRMVTLLQALFPLSGK